MKQKTEIKIIYLFESCVKENHKLEYFQYSQQSTGVEIYQHFLQMREESTDDSIQK